MHVGKGRHDGLKNAVCARAQTVLIGGNDTNHIATQKLAAITHSELSSCGLIDPRKPHNCQTQTVGKRTSDAVKTATSKTLRKTAI